MVKVPGSEQPQKMFIIMFTCLNVCAMQLNLLPDLSSKSFVQAFQRFVCKFGVPDCVYSDNARSFAKGTDATVCGF